LPGKTPTAGHISLLFALDVEQEFNPSVSLGTDQRFAENVGRGMALGGNQRGRERWVCCSSGGREQRRKEC